MFHSVVSIYYQDKFWSCRKGIFDEMKRRSQVAASCLRGALKHEFEEMHEIALG